MSSGSSSVGRGRADRRRPFVDLRRILPFLAALLVHPPATAADPDFVLLSIDVPGTVAGLPSNDRDVLSIPLHGGGASVVSNLGDLLPHGIDVDALSVAPGGEIVFSTSTSFSSLGVDAADEDLLLLRSGVVSVVFDGSAAGLPETADIDAVHVISLAPLEIYYSVAHPTTIGGVVYSGNDILRYNGAVHSRHVEGATMLGTDARRTNVDGLWVDPSRGEFVVSLDVSIAGVSAVVAADDEDLLQWFGATLRVLVDSSLHDVPSPGIDVDALHLGSFLFADGFESGNVSKWSASTS